MISIICFPSSIIVVDMLNIFIKNINYLKSKGEQHIEDYIQE